ncbi:CaiB/BaiF CoA transferase family protein [Paracoccus aestuariivivens]|uniref:CoA transferase n=1 Tax=Paracoccus aestuariivivens TaxID=1820333 RepID=A0A6L6JDE2_9RHOB|nr:CoA transferase [Paracoccus aestuariivivens]MTH80010.1 CoA transferase [Paracoccus aestuariivivens]
MPAPRADQAAQPLGQTPVIGALSDLRVIDLTHFLAGPYCTQMLADQGADVIKVEPPGGDVTRTFGPFLPDDDLQAFAGYFGSVNRNKRSITLDMKSEAGREALLRLIDGADVVVENYRAGVMERHGLSYETLTARNPRLVYAAVRGFGDKRGGESPYGDWPAYDVVAQAFGGIMAITGPEGGEATKIGPGVGDIIPAMFAAFGVLAAVLHARRTGQGQFVDISMVDSILAICERVIHQHSFAGVVPKPQGNQHPFLAPFGTFPTLDGLCTITAYDDRMFGLLCDLLELTDVPQDVRFSTWQTRYENRVALIDVISAVTRLKTKAELMTLLGGKVPFGPVYDVSEIVQDPHFIARQMIVPVDQPGTDKQVLLAGIPVKLTETPGAVRRAAPVLGQHTNEILTEAGFSPDRIETMRQSGAFGPVVRKTKERA